MSASPSTASRYARLRGKSMSEPYTPAANGQTDAGSPSFRSSFASPGWQQRSKTQEDLHDTIDISAIDPDYPVPPIPRPPSQKEHYITTRPRAAVIPTPPIFGEPVTPTPSQLRRSTPDLVPLPDSPPASESTADSIASDETPGQATDPGEQKQLSRHDDQEDRVVGEEDPLLLADILEAETDRILAEQNRLAMARLHQQMIATESRFSLASSATRTTPRKSPMLERFGFFSRGRRSQAPSSSASSTTASVDYTHGQLLEPLLSPVSFWEPNTQLMTPPTSPMSPPRDLDKSVTVCYRGECVNITITDQTHTSVDILSQASKLMRNSVNTAASNLHECCGAYGIERRLRRYERVGEVLSSWPPDARNMLVIRHGESPDGDNDLDIQFVPVDETPPTFSLQLFYCSRPGKWNKRWITLLKDGQMLSTKKAMSSSGDGDAQRLCDLSCYDVYTAMSEPTMLLDERSGKSPKSSPVKSLKPPKKHVFAVRCQDRPTSYSETGNYVHFFSTDNQAVAEEFKTQVHVWRSWFMVKTRRDIQRKRLMMDDGATGPAPPRTTSVPRIGPAPRITPVKHAPVKSVSHVKVSPGHVMRISVDETPYSIPDTIDELQPLVNMERFEKHIDDFGKDWVPDPKFDLPPATPGADFGISISSPSSTTSLLGQGKDTPDAASPAEQRRMRRDLKRSLASIDPNEQHPAPATTDDASKILIAVTEPQASPTRRSRSASDAAAGTPTAGQRPPPSPPKADVAPWLPSAAEHTAKLRAEQAREQARLERLNAPPVTPQRPATSYGGLGAGAAVGAPGAGAGAAAGPGRRAPRFKQASLPGNVEDWMKGADLDPSRTSRYLEVPHSHGGRGPSSKPSRAGPPSSSVRSGGGSAHVAPVPAIWRANSKGSSSPGQRPSTSGGERASMLQHHHQQQQQPQPTGTRERSGSNASLRHGHGGHGMSFTEAVPPMPPMPLCVPASLKQGVGMRPPVPLRDAGRALTARP